MFHRKTTFTAIALMAGSSGIVWGYDDDDLLCRPGWSPELMQQQLWQQHHQQQVLQIEYQHTLQREFVAEQRRMERIQSARIAKREKEAQKREQQIARRKADHVSKPVGAKTVDGSAKALKLNH